MPVVTNAWELNCNETDGTLFFSSNSLNFNLETYLPSLPSLCPVDQISSFFIIIIKCLLSNPTEVAAVVTGVHDMRYLLPWYNTNREQFDAMKFLDRFNITFTFIIKFKFSSSSHFYDFQKPKSNIYETE